MEPVVGKVTPGMPLSEAFEKTGRLDIECLPVVSPGREDEFIGVLDCRAVCRQLSV